MERPGWLKVVLMGGLLVIFAQLLSVPVQASHEPSTEQEAAWNLVKERCYLCHYLDRPDTKFAPSLKDLFKRPTLMNGKPLNEGTVSNWISEGSPNMPAFQYSLTPKQIQLIVNFLKDGRASSIPMLRNER